MVGTAKGWGGRGCAESLWALSVLLACRGQVAAIQQRSLEATVRLELATEATLERGAAEARREVRTDAPPSWNVLTRGVLDALCSLGGMSGSVRQVAAALRKEEQLGEVAARASKESGKIAAASERRAAVVEVCPDGQKPRHYPHIRTIDTMPASVSPCSRTEVANPFTLLFARAPLAS